MTALAVGRHSADRSPDGYVTAWIGDLNPDLPTQLLPLPATSTPEDPVDRATNVHFLRRVLHAVRRL